MVSNIQGWFLRLLVVLLALHTAHCLEENTQPFCRLDNMGGMIYKYMDCSNVISSFNTTQLPSEPPGIGWFYLHDSPDLQLKHTSFDHKAFEITWLIRLERSNLTTLEPFTTLPRLRVLSIKSTDLSNISSSSFLGLERLTRVTLNDNRILSADICTNINDLKYFDVANNEITVLNDDSFKGLVRLKSLDFTDNLIESISPGAFTELTQLQSLKLGSNNLRSLSRALFQTNTELYDLDLSGNNLANLANYPLNIPSLQQLKLNNGKIQSIPVDYFTNLRSVSTLHLSSNELNRIEDVHLEALPKLSRLYLDSNKLTSINVTAIRELYPAFAANAWEHGGMNVKNNPWNCSKPVGSEMVKPCKGIGIITSIYELQAIGWYGGSFF